ncbi:MAG: DNA polymerase III subunit alpha [Candidatus Dadabacteria bacterium]|nr:MAG: DNA polymerase III subunit alpha [Candidatus Dadabacteria bacterium]
MNFVHLHLHTQYSLLDGLNKIPDVVKKASELNQSAIAVTDHGNLHGAVEFYKECTKADIKPIIGCELYVAGGSRFEKKPQTQGGKPNFHLTAIAINQAGYKNLCRLLTRAYKEGFYHKPRVDHELLKEYSDGLIILSGCMNSEVAYWITENNQPKLEECINFYRETFGDNYYLEIQPHNLEKQQLINSVLLDYGERLGIPLVATTDVHYLEPEDAVAQEVLMCIATGKKLSDPDRIKHEGASLYFKDGKTMLAEFRGFKGAEEAIARTEEIADKVSLAFELGTFRMPVFQKESALSDEDFLDEEAKKGLEKRLSEYKEQGKVVNEDEYRERLKEELKTIKKLGFASYFLVVADFIVWAKERGIPVGPGRGSAAGSLVAWALRITEIDPIAHKLIFERFLNPERVSPPDIDVDFCVYGRDEIIKYVSEKYGKECVAQIATFGSLKAKQAIKDVGRVLGLSYSQTDKIAQLVPAPRQGFDFSLEESLKMEKRLAEYAEKEGKELISLALKVEGLTRHASTHAAGVVISSEPLSDFMPLMVDKDGREVTQYNMKCVEELGFVKFDFLGLKTLTVINTALQLIKQSRGEELDILKIPLDDKKTYELLCKGRTTGVFQLESSGITEMTMKLKPSCFDDIVAILALYRPGPLDSGMAEHYIERKHGREKVEYLHPAMKEILDDTYGIILYQEQIMQLARELAGYSMAEADLLRRAMGKKIPEEMAKQKSRFLSGAKKRGISEKAAEEIFSQMETFARYGFNRSHSAAYALISYQTAYLKAHYEVEFMTALMSHEMNDSEKVMKNINECRAAGIEVLGPDVNKSLAGFSVEGGKIRFGLSAVKGVGVKAVEEIIQARKSLGEFEGIEDFVSKVNLQVVNKRVLESLIKCGAFDFTGLPRKAVFEGLDKALLQNQRKEKPSPRQLSLAGLGGGGGVGMRRTRKLKAHEEIVRAELKEWPVNVKLAYEREALGFFLTGHPLTKYQGLLKKLRVVALSHFREKVKSGQTVYVAGVVNSLKLRNTRAGRRYASFKLEDQEGIIDVIAWPEVYEKSALLLEGSDPLLIKGEADISDERQTLIALNVDSLLNAQDEKAQKAILTVTVSDKLEEKLEKLDLMLRKHKGRCPVQIYLKVRGRVAVVELKDEPDKPVCVAPSEELANQVEQLFGRPVLTFV